MPSSSQVTKMPASGVQPVPNSGIKTTGELRTFLATMMIGVKNGHVKADDARSVVKIAAQINESFYTELKNKQLAFLSQETQVPLGDLKIGS